MIGLLYLLARSSHPPASAADFYLLPRWVWYRAPDARAVAVAHLTTTQCELVDFQAQRQPTVLYVWAEWCGYCRHTSPAIESLHRDGY